MDIQFEIEVLESTYFHLMDVKRVQDVVTDYGETTESNEPMTIAQNVKCALSFSNSRTFNTIQSDTTNNVSYDSIIFCSPSADIKVGDTLYITLENGQITKYQAGEPRYYITHLEVPSLKEGVA